MNTHQFKLASPDRWRQGVGVNRIDQHHLAVGEIHRWIADQHGEVGGETPRWREIVGVQKCHNLRIRQQCGQPLVTGHTRAGVGVLP